MSVVFTSEVLGDFLTPGVSDAAWRIEANPLGRCRLEVSAWLDDPLESVQSVRLRMSPFIERLAKETRRPESLPTGVLAEVKPVAHRADLSVVEDCARGRGQLQLELVTTDGTVRALPATVLPLTDVPLNRFGRFRRSFLAAERTDESSLVVALTPREYGFEDDPACMDTGTCARECSLTNRAACFRAAAEARRESRPSEVVRLLSPLCAAGNAAACLQAGVASPRAQRPAEVLTGLDQWCAAGLVKACILLQGGDDLTRMAQAAEWNCRSGYSCLDFRHLKELEGREASAPREWANLIDRICVGRRLEGNCVELALESILRPTPPADRLTVLASLIPGDVCKLPIDSGDGRAAPRVENFRQACFLKSFAEVIGTGPRDTRRISRNLVVSALAGLDLAQQLLPGVPVE